MDKKYIIESRYEHWTIGGKKFTDWFIFHSNPLLNENEANELISEIKKNFKFIDDKTKLKHEYRIKDNDEYEKELKELKKKADKLSKEHEKYLKSDKYKELLKKKRQSAKERKERQKKYLEEHGL